ncbi:hypothetical protein FA95DRAFT_1604175 [Auriscalpium vulgare]|uniref:Uncharacterized protein n=1 Tax=Auriscalpium vulgare TaxID=40419 RepID=A0ACB8S095_9AGAM|nr:hypothetical protein FA95DRAFT_1604175 [Auriscalpium vulgare]
MPALFVPALIAGMIFTGSSNSLWSKYQDMQCVENCTDPDPSHHVLYEQPVWQTLQMFLGEMLCFLPVLYTVIASRRSAPLALPSDADDEPSDTLADPSAKLPLQKLSGARILLLWLPALCDCTATTLMNIGLLYTPVSIYQMTRGALVLFVGVLSVIFLHRRLHLYQWLSLATVILGVSLVGFSGSLIKDTLHTSMLDATDEPEATKVLLGVFFILFAQIFTATQFVVEEKILSRYSVAPLLAVGYEGLFGTLSIVLALPLLPLITPSIPADSVAAPWFDLSRGWHQLVDTPTVLYSGLVIACSIALYNYFGLSVTKHVSATARSLTDTCRTLTIWIVSLGLGWEVLLFPISLLQVAGFALLVYGTFLFNNLVHPPAFLRPPPPATASTDDTEAEAAPLLDETARLPADLGMSGFDVVPESPRQRSRSKSHTRNSTSAAA